MTSAVTNGVEMILGLNINLLFNSWTAQPRDVQVSLS